MTMRTKYITIFIAAVVSLTVQAQEFSADTVTHDSSGKIFRGKVYRSATMIRAGADAASSNDGDPTFIIVDIPKQVSNTVIPNRKAIMVAHGTAALNKAGIALPINENPCMPTSGSPPSTRTSCKNLGEETVNGRHTVKWEVSETMRGQSSTQYVWVDAKLHCIVKMQMGQSTMELQNIQEGPQPATLFALPTGYQVMDVGGR